MSIVLSAAVSNGLRASCVDFASNVIAELAAAGVLNCGLEKAMSLFDFEAITIVSKRSASTRAARASAPKVAKPAKTPKPTMILPFCGVVVTDWCKGVRLNHGLHTQCTNRTTKGARYCTTCNKSASSSEGGKPTFGDIEDRVGHDVDYRDPKGTLTKPYANVAEKLGLNLTEAATAAEPRLGWTIPAAQLVKRTRGQKQPQPKRCSFGYLVGGQFSVKSVKIKRTGTVVVKASKVASQPDLIAQMVASGRR